MTKPEQPETTRYESPPEGWVVIDSLIEGLTRNQKMPVLKDALADRFGIRGIKPQTRADALPWPAGHTRMCIDPDNSEGEPRRYYSPTVQEAIKAARKKRARVKQKGTGVLASKAVEAQKEKEYRRHLQEHGAPQGYIECNAAYYNSFGRKPVIAKRIIDQITKNLKEGVLTGFDFNDAQYKDYATDRRRHKTGGTVYTWRTAIIEARFISPEYNAFIRKTIDEDYPLLPKGALDLGSEQFRKEVNIGRRRRRESTNQVLRDEGIEVLQGYKKDTLRPTEYVDATSNARSILYEHYECPFEADVRQHIGAVLRRHDPAFEQKSIDAWYEFGKSKHPEWIQQTPSGIRVAHTFAPFVESAVIQAAEKRKKKEK